MYRVERDFGFSAKRSADEEHAGQVDTVEQCFDIVPMCFPGPEHLTAAVTSLYGACRQADRRTPMTAKVSV